MSVRLRSQEAPISVDGLHDYLKSRSTHLSFLVPNLPSHASPGRATAPKCPALEPGQPDDTPGLQKQQVATNRPGSLIRAEVRIVSCSESAPAGGCSAGLGLLRLLLLEGVARYPATGSGLTCYSHQNPLLCSCWVRLR